MRKWSLLILLAAFLGICSVYSDQGQIRDGVLDLREYSFENEGPIRLDGNWNFLWQQLTSMPQDFLNESGDALSTFPVPGKWSPEFSREIPDDGLGYASYHLKILLPRQDFPQMGLKIGFIGTAARIFVNGELIYQSGEVGASPERSRPEWRPEAVLFDPQSSELDLVMQISNYHDRTSGVEDSIVLGTAEQVYDLRSKALLYDIFLFGALFIMAFYHIALYLYRRSDRAPLFFGFFTLVLALRIVVYEEIAILMFFPQMPWSILAKLGYLSFSLGVVLFSAFIYSVFTEHMSNLALRAFATVGLLYSLFVIVSPNTFYMQLLLPFQIFTLLVAFYLFFVLFQALRSRRPGAAMFLLGFSAMFITVLHDILKTIYITPTPFLVPLGLLVFVFFQSLVMIHKFTEAFRQSEKMAVNLRQINQSMERFVPREFLTFLQRESLLDVRLGDHASYRMTVLFADIRDFTSLSEKLTPDENFRFINSFLNRMGPIIRNHRGFVDKYLGDGIMALFPDNPQDAIEAAIDLRLELQQYNLDRAKLGYQPINFGVGIHTGDLMLGTIGENQRMDGTVISDAVNMASRIETLTKKHGIGIAMSEETQICLNNCSAYSLRHIGREKVKGKEKEISVFEVIGRRKVEP